MKLLITMGVYHKTDPRFQSGWAYYGAVLQIIDWEKKKVIKEVSYQSPPEHLGGTGQLLFTGADIVGDKVYVCTKTEVIRYNALTWEPEFVISYPFFNDLHSVICKDNQLIVANTGRETVQYFDLNGKFIREVNMAYTPPERRFRPDFDYRTVRDTKPHEVHINQVFDLHGEVWVTRLIPQDAVSVENPKKKIKIDVGQPHDGCVKNDKVFFTTTNGYVVVADINKLQVVRVIDLNSLYGKDELIGWCRGVEVIGNYAFVAFTRIRETKHKTFKFWEKIDKKKTLPSRIVQIDLQREVIVDTYEVTHDGAAIYTVAEWNI